MYIDIQTILKKYFKKSNIKIIYIYIYIYNFFYTQRELKQSH